MNIYVVVEGQKTEKLVYASWIPLVNPELTHAIRLDNVDHNSYFIEGGGGLPYYFQTIVGAIENIATIRPNGYALFDRLVVVVDSEEMTLVDKRNEIRNFIDDHCASNNLTIDSRIIVQHFCFEAWALANTNLFRGNFHNPKLKAYVASYNVSKQDPELLPPKLAEQLNRAQHAKKYLKLLLGEKFPNKGYSANNPGPVCHEHYFKRIEHRRVNTGHVDSFGAIFAAFQ